MRLGIPESAFDMYGVEFHDRLSFLKAGLFYADQVIDREPDATPARSPPRRWAAACTGSCGRSPPRAA